MEQPPQRKPRRVNRIHATKEQLLALKFGGDIAPLKVQAPLIPPPQRSCSRQTGAIVYRHYDGGRNPFEPFDELAALSKSATQRTRDPGELGDDGAGDAAQPLPPSQAKMPHQLDARQLTLRRIMSRAKAPPPVVQSARQVREEVNRETRKQFIRTHSALLKHSHIVESAKVDELVRTVLALNSIDAALENGTINNPRSLQSTRNLRKSFMMPTGNLRTSREEAQQQGSSKALNPSTGRPTKDDKFRFSVDTVKSLYREFEALNLDHDFLNCFSTGSPVLFGGTVVTLAQLKSASDVNLDIRFDHLLRIVRPDVPESHFTTVMEQWKAHREEMKTSTTASFRDKFDLATVRDIERVWSGLIDSFKNETQYVTAAPPHDRGLTIDQFVAYVENLRSLLTADDARTLFEKYSVPGGVLSKTPQTAPSSPMLPPIVAASFAVARHRKRPGKVVISEEPQSEQNSPLLGRFQSFSGVSNHSDDVATTTTTVNINSTRTPALTDTRPIMTIQGFAMTVAQH